MKPTISAVVGLIVLVFNATASHSATVEGRVYLDTNRNGQWDGGETGMAGVLVSDGSRVAATNKMGCYRLETDETRVLLWISVPRDHCPTTTFWRWADAAKAQDFGLASRPQPNDFCFIQISDAHIGRDDVLRQFARHVNELCEPIAFVIHTGDLVGGIDVVPIEKASAQFDCYLRAAAAFTVPLLNMPGNHEHVAIGVPGADKTDPRYGKGLYRQMLGPPHYSFDWGPVHFVALDGTSLPYAEKLGAEQLAWLKADLAFQPHDKPLVLFCHQSAPQLGDAKELANALQGRRVMGIFCGHLHRTFVTQLGNIPVYHAGAFSGQWWSGPCSDGSPQGFQLIQIKEGRMKTVYTNREGRYPLYIVSPTASAEQSGKIEIKVAVVDFGKPVEMAAKYADRPVPLTLDSRDELWAIWKGVVDTALANDGKRVVQVSSRLGDDVSTHDTSYLVLNGRPEPYRADAPAKLVFEARGVRAAHDVLLDGTPLGTIPAGVHEGDAVSIDIPADRLAKVARVTVRSDSQTGSVTVGPIWLEYKGEKIRDLRYVSFERHIVGRNDAEPLRAEKDWFFCLP